MVRAEHPLEVEQQLPEQAQRPRRVTALAGPARDVAPGGESTGVVRAEHPLEVGQQLPEQAQRPRRITALAGWSPITPAPSSKPANADSLRSWAWSWSLRHGSFPAC